jgi:hypothetical protein
MRKNILFLTLLASALISAPAMILGQSPATPSAASQPESQQHKPQAVKKTADSNAEIAGQLKALQEAIEQQKAATEQLQQQLQLTQQQLQQTQQQLQKTQATAQAADAKAADVETNEAQQAQKIQADLSQAESTSTATAATVQKNEKKVADLEHPDSIAYKGIRIKPGGFLEMSSYFRSHATLSDLATTFNTIPLAGQANTKLTEYGETARDSRISLRADADAGSTKLTGYFEMDFFGTGPSSNPNQSTSYNPRLRLAWSRAKFADGWSITGGQMWNLTTLNRKGTEAEPSLTWIPNIIEAQYSIGYNWGRFAEFRFNKQIGTKFNAAFSLANPSYLNSGATNTNTAVAGLASTGAGVDGNSLVSTCTTSTATPPVTTCTNTPTYSTNLAPDLLAKLTYDDPKLGHYEVKALGRVFRDRDVPTLTVPGVDNHAYGGGAGFGAIVPVVAKKVDFMAQGLFGKGISRYTDSGQYDFVVQSTGQNMQTVLGLSSLVGFETHPTPKVEIDTLFGNEYYGRTTYIASGTTLAGYGLPTATNTGCYYETAALATAAGVSSTCTGNNRDLWNAKLYGYYDAYKGTIGIVRFGAEFDYVERTTWSGAGGLAPRGNEKNFFTTMRWLLP